jgi:hypothetical protein
MQGASKSELRKFGLTVGTAFAVLGLISWARGHVVPPRVLWTLAVLLVVPGLVAPAVLGPVRTVWMRAAAVMGEFNSRVLLTIFFYVVIAPFGFVLRRIRDPLNRSLKDDRPSQWIKREPVPVDRARYEQQF